MKAEIFNCKIENRYHGHFLQSVNEASILDPSSIESEYFISNVIHFKKWIYSTLLRKLKWAEALLTLFWLHFQEVIHRTVLLTTLI